MSDVDPWLDRSSDDVRRLHLEPLERWLTENRGDEARTRLLDYGCGDGLLAAMLDDEWVIEGYDPSEPARRAARSRRSMAVVHDTLVTVPEGSFDVMILSSVTQYFAGADELGRVIDAAKGWLVPSGLVVITDVVTVDSSRVRDARDIISGTTRRIGSRAAGVHLLRAALRRSGPLLQLDLVDIDALAAGAGLTCEVLPQNLSQFSSRRSVVLRNQQPAA